MVDVLFAPQTSVLQTDVMDTSCTHGHCFVAAGVAAAAIHAAVPAPARSGGKINTKNSVSYLPSSFYN